MSRRLAAIFVGLTAALIVWRLAPESARRAVTPLAGALTGRLREELKPIWLGVADRFKAPPPDPTAGQSAAGLSAPTGGPVRRRAAVLETPDGQKAPMLSVKGVAIEHEVRSEGGGPVLQSEGETDNTRSAANKLIVVAGSLAAFFMLIAWFKGAGSEKSLT